ncbi:MAG: hypothetical protein H6658_00130 [Ardenticatenaceae bacterium]|nr:hypothetical protein [Ardenticatenaceae bacterium]
MGFLHAGHTWLSRTGQDRKRSGGGDNFGQSHPICPNETSQLSPDSGAGSGNASGGGRCVFTPTEVHASSGFQNGHTVTQVTQYLEGAARPVISRV